MKEREIFLDIQLLKKENPWFNFHKNIVLDLPLRLKSIISPKNKIKLVLN